MVFHCSYSFHTFYWIYAIYAFQLVINFLVNLGKLRMTGFANFDSLICMTLGDGFLEFLTHSVLLFLSSFFFSDAWEALRTFFHRLTIPNHLCFLTKCYQCVLLDCQNSTFIKKLLPEKFVCSAFASRTIQFCLNYIKTPYVQ